MRTQGRGTRSKRRESKKGEKDKGETNDGITRVSCKKEAKQHATDIFMRQFLWLDSEYTSLGRVLWVPDSQLAAALQEEEGKNTVHTP